jgi:hypothetical protein
LLGEYAMWGSDPRHFAMLLNPRHFL